MNSAIETIASDIGVERYSGEPERNFAFRTMYSASRFWTEAMCINDGSDGTSGIPKQTLNKRLSRWISRAEAVASGLSAWFKVEDGGIPVLYNRLLDVEDIVEAGVNGGVVARKPTVLDTKLGCALVVGTHDFGRSENARPGVDLHHLVTSGLASIVSESIFPAGNLPSLPWISEQKYLQWSSSADYDDIEYIDVSSSRWRLRDSSTWTQSPTGYLDGFTLARRDFGAHQPPQFLLCKMSPRGKRVSPIGRDEAQELYFALREHCGNPATASYGNLDSKHIRMHIPIGFLPGRHNRFVDAVSWPVDGIDDNFDRVARVESINLIKNALAASHVVLKESER